MRIEDSNVSLTPIEVELLLAALAYYERQFRSERSVSLADNIRVLRGKLIDAG